MNKFKVSGDPTTSYDKVGYHDYISGHGLHVSQEEFEENFQDAVGQIKCVMSVVNNTAFVQMSDAIELLKKSPYYRQAVKKHMNDAIQHHHEYERSLKDSERYGIDFFAPSDNVKDTITRDQLFDWYLDIGACSYKRNHAKVEDLKNVVVKALKRNFKNYTKERQDKVEDADKKKAIKAEVDGWCEMLGSIVASNTLLEYTEVMFNAVIKDYKEMHHVDYTRVFKPFLMENTIKDFKEGATALSKILPIKTADIDLNTEQAMLDAFSAFENAIVDDLNIQASANEAIEDNADLLPEDVHKEYREHYDRALDDYKLKNRK